MSYEKYKTLLNKKESQKYIKLGINKATELIAPTLGVKGNRVFIDREFTDVEGSDDGITILKEIELEDPREQLGVKILREASAKTNEKEGDGPQPLSAKVLTPNGFIKMGDIKIEDEICGTNGTVQKVVGVFPKGIKRVYEVRFVGGRIVECCDNHLWKVINNLNNGKEELLTTKQLIENGLSVKKNNGYSQYKYFVPVSKAEFVNKSLPLDPYLVGVLIGDGSLSGTGSIEFWIGISKKHIIDKVVLPDGLYLHTQYVENKNCFRVKIQGKTIDGKTIKDIIKDIGLYGVRSDTKFIPKQYLYSDTQSRRRLLQGLSDTDGYISNRGLLQYSIVSKKLYLDVLELLRGLGKTTYNCLFDRKDNNGSYSNKPIYRIVELKGYKYGNKIVEIIKTDKEVEMQCIKVSNKDNLYFTDNYILTHNTTSTAIIANELVNQIIGDEEDVVLLGKDKDVLEIKKGLDSGLDKVLKFIDEHKIEITSDNQIAHIGRISSNSEEVGNMLKEIFSKLGKDAVVNVEDSNSVETSYEIKEGMSFEKGYVSEAFMTNPEREEAVLDEAKVLITDCKIQDIEDATHLAGLFENKINDLLIIAGDITGIPLKTLVINKIRGSIRVVAVKAPGVGNVADYLKDISTLTGATLISSTNSLALKDVKVEHLGKADKVVVNKESTTIIGGKGDKAEVEDRILSLKKRVEDEKSEYEKLKLKERIGKMTNGVCTIKVGGTTGIEARDKNAKVEDAVSAVKSALKEGVVAGGGVILFRSSDVLDSEHGGECILKVAANKPLEQIMRNADLDAGEIERKISKNKNLNHGYDVENKKMGDMIEMGVIDSAGVVKSALKNAVSIAKQVLTGSGALTLVRKEEKNKDEL